MGVGTCRRYLVILLLCGCVSATERAETHRNLMILDAAIHASRVVETTAEELPAVEASLPEERREDTKDAAVLRDLHDIAQRASMALKGAAPLEADDLNVKRLTDEDDTLFHVDAGLQERKGSRRRMLREMPERAADALADVGKRIVKRIIPGWVWLVLALSAFVAAGLWLWGKWLDIDRKRKARAFDDLDDAVESTFDEGSRRRIALHGVALAEHRRRNAERKHP